MTALLFVYYFTEIFLLKAVLMVHEYFRRLHFHSLVFDNVLTFELTSNGFAEALNKFRWLCSYSMRHFFYCYLIMQVMHYHTSALNW